MPRAFLVALLLSAVAGIAHAQSPASKDAFSFDPVGKPLAPQPPGWWNLAVSPDGKTIVTANPLERGSEWRAWDVETGRVETVREPAGTRFVAYSPDGSLVATANFDGVVRLYDAMTRKVIAEGKAHTAGVNALSFSGDGSLLATAGLDKTARLWDVAEGRKRAAAFVPLAVFEGSEQAVYAVGLSPDGTRLVTGGPDGKVRLWDVPKLQAGKTARVAKEKKIAADHKTTVECVAFSPDGKRFASGSWDNTAKLFDADGTEIATLRGHNRGVMALAFSPTSTALVTVSGDHASNVAGEVRLWAAADGADLGLIGKEPDMAVGVGFGPAGTTVATCGRDRAIHLWDVEGRKQTKELRLPSDSAGTARVVQALAYSPDGKLLAVAGEGGAIDLWDVRDRKVTRSLAGHTDAVTALAWSKDGRRLVSASSDKTARVWDAQAGKALQTLKPASAVYATAITPDGKTVATGGFDMAIRLWDADTGTETAKLDGHTASVRCLSFDSTGELLASGGSDFCIRVWKPTTKDAPKELRGHTRTVRGLAFVGPGLLASGGDDATAMLWNVASGEPVHTFGPFADTVSCVAASPHGGFLVAGLGNGRLHVCDPATGAKRALLTGPTDAVAAVAVAPDGQAIAAGGFDKVIRVWSPAADPGLAVVTFADQGGPVRATAVSPDRTLVATGGADGRIRVFHAVTGALQTKWQAHDGPVEDIAYARDGSALISGGADGKAKVWKTAGQTLIYTHTLSGPVRRVALSKTATLGAAATNTSDVIVFDIAAKTEKKLAAEGVPAALDFLPDDTLLTAGELRAYVWDVSGPRVLTSLDNGQFAKITAAAVGADGKLIVLAGDPAPGTFLATDAGTCRVMATSLHHPESPATMRMNDTGVSAIRAAVAADGRMIVVVGGDGTVRAWEWPDAKLVRKFSTHAVPVHGLAVSSRGEFAVTASADGTARRWPASKGEPLVYAARLLDESKQTWFARLSPDGKVLATGGDDGVLRLRRGTPGNYRPVAGDYPAVFTAVPSPNGAVLATGHLDGTIRVWDTKTWQQLRKLDRHAHRVWALAFSPDGTRLVSGGGNWDDTVPGEVRVWDTATWKTVHEAQAHNDLVFSVAVASDNKTFASGSKDGSIILWDLGTGKPGLTLQGGGSVRCVTFAKDGRLFSCGAGHLLQWWDAATGKLLGTGNGRANQSERFAPTPDGKHLVLAAKVGSEFIVALWDIEKNELVREFAGRHVGQINAVAVSPDGKTVMTGGGQYNTSPRFVPGPGGPWGVPITVNKDGRASLDYRPACELKCWDLETGRPIAELAGHKFWAEAIAFSPDGATLVTAGGVKDQPGELRTWDATALRPAAERKVGKTLTCGRFSPDGTLFAAGTSAGVVFVWSVDDTLRGVERSQRAIGKHGVLIRSVEWSRDGKWLAWSGEDGVVQVWAAPFDRPTRRIDAHDRPVYGLAFSPDGTRLATAAGDYKTHRLGEARVWDVATGAEAYRLPDSPEPVWGVAFIGADQLATAQGGPAAVKVWDTKTRKELRALTGPQSVRSLSATPDGKWLGLTGGTDGLVKIWEAGTWREAYEVVGHPGKIVFGLDFGADGQTILSAGGDAAAVVWKLPGGDWKLPEFMPPPPPQQRGLRPRAK